MVSQSHSEKGSTAGTVKFLCSYNGRILPRSVDGKLRYVGGMTRVLAVDRSISFAELMVKLGEFCGYSVELRCQLPDGDLETLISIKSDDELKMLMQEYDVLCPSSKIKSVLSPPKSLKTVSPPSSVDLSNSPSFAAANYRRVRTRSPPVGYGVGVYRDAVTSRYYSPRLICRDPRCCANWHYG
ncbi:hypothetical protein K2173_001044 [Erythroxylum novogranatense]|uniref:PB1 domain-containing protein n=1 Tax=Erythroxylum novogranatense TaxID=1862640 RepID=A0AAV8SIY8_9ROSI|nr:hypothetical protein K2173_001044 [Erythroxylum novogranatense]